MRGTVAKRLRAKAGHKPSNEVEYSLKYFNRLSQSVVSNKVARVYTATLKYGTTRARYQELKRKLKQGV